jgi:hypothetical protein
LPEIGLFLRKLALFELSWVAATRSLVENDRPPSFQCALDGWYAPRFLGFSLNGKRFPFLNLVLASRQ